MSAPRDDNDQGDDLRATYLFRWDADEEEWVEEQKFVGSDAVEVSDRRAAVAVNDEAVFVGAPLDDETDTNSGAVYVFDPSLREFLRGDASGDGTVDAIPDALFLLRWNFGTGDEPSCMDAADSDDSGTVAAIPDALFLLRWGFQEGEAPPDPGTEECGVDPNEEPDDTTCNTAPEACL